MTLKNLKTTLSVAALVLIAAAAQAKDLSVKLTGDQEVPPMDSKATGTAKLTIKDDMTVTGKIKTKDIAGTVAHVHLAAPGKSGPPIITLVKGSDGEWSVPENSKLTDEQYKSFKAGDLYVNVHSDAHPSGEIRGQVKP